MLSGRVNLTKLVAKAAVRAAQRALLPKLASVGIGTLVAAPVVVPKAALHVVAKVAAIHIGLLRVGGRGRGSLYVGGLSLAVFLLAARLHSSFARIHLAVE